MRLASFALSVFCVFAADRAAACSCSGPDSPCSRTQGAKALFAGHVVARQVGPDATIYTFQVSEAFRGVQGELVQVQSGNHGEACGQVFESGQEYFIHAGRYDGVSGLVTGLCWQNRLLADAQEEVLYLRTLQSLAPPKQANYGHISGLVANREGDVRWGPPSWPVAGVGLRAERVGSPALAARTRDSGYFDFFRVPPGTYRVRVAAPGKFSTLKPSAATVNVKAGACAEVRFQHTSRAVLEGMLYDSDGDPDNSTDIFLIPAGGEPGKPLGGDDSELETDAEDGKFRFEVPPGDYRLAFRPLGNIERISYPAPLHLTARAPGSGRAPAKITFHIPPQIRKSLRIRVVDTSGVPVDSANVHLSGRALDGSMIWGDGETEADGEITFEVSPLDYEIWVNCAGQKLPRVRVPAAQLSAHITLPAGCELQE